MPRLVSTLSDLAVRNKIKEIEKAQKKSACFSVGGVNGLMMRVRANSNGYSKIWTLRSQSNGLDQWHQLGIYPQVSLAQARMLANDFLSQSSTGQDPFAKAKANKAEKVRQLKQKAKDEITFGGALSEWLDYKQDRDWKHKDVTRAKEEPRFHKHLGSLMPIPLNSITSQDIANALDAIWCSNPSIADRLLIYIRAYLRWAMTVKKCRSQGINPADSQFIKDLLPPRSHRKQEKPMPALSVEQMPIFMKALHEYGKTHLSALCLEFAILTCSRSSNARKAHWNQFTEDLSLWEINAEEMKITRNGQHKIPLSRQAKTLLQEAKNRCFDDSLVFPSDRRIGSPWSDATLNQVIKSLHATEVQAGREGWIDREQSKREKLPIVVVQHGVSRATFKTWAEGSRQDHRATELVLHHEIDPRLRGAYDRSEDMKQKAVVLQNWADFCYSLIESE